MAQSLLYEWQFRLFITKGCLGLIKGPHLQVLSEIGTRLIDQILLGNVFHGSELRNLTVHYGIEVFTEVSTSADWTHFLAWLDTSVFQPLNENVLTYSFLVIAVAIKRRLEIVMALQEHHRLVSLLQVIGWAISLIKLLSVTWLVVYVSSVHPIADEPVLVQVSLFEHWFLELLVRVMRVNKAHVLTALVGRDFSSLD